ncbi:MAG: ABC transporter substrate-binding protein, partial [Peptococcaceae bacterium]|nr:ABC transporter substrate-binding protein [Peptococcaceae bacterium]
EYLKEENAYLFRLRKNATWHDGRKLTAGDVVFTVGYTKTHPYQYVDPSIIREAKVVDDYTVKLYLDRPYAPFLEYVAATLPILPEHVWKTVQNPAQFQQKEALVGSGPYRLLDYNREQGSYLYESYDNYYLGKPKIRQIKFVKIGSDMSAAALRQKQVSAAQVPPEVVKDLEKEGYKVLTGSHDFVAQMIVNHRKDPMSSREFRQALAYAVDRRALVDTCQRGHGIEGSAGLIPPDSFWHNANIVQYSHSPEKAADLLGSLGYVKEGGYYEKNGQVLSLELLVSPSGFGVPGAPGDREGEMIKSQLEKAGIKINLRSMEPKTLDNLVGEWKFDLALAGHGALGGDPEILNKAITGKAFWSVRYEKNGEMLDLLKQQVQEMDRDRRKKLVDRIQALYAQEAPCIPLYYPTWYYVHDGRVNLYYTREGIAIGIPLPFNKMSFVG